MTDVTIIVPARYASTRYPAKPLAILRGANGTERTLLERSVRAARAAARGEAQVFVATDDDRIAAEAARIDAAVIMTDPGCRNGTERVAQAVERAEIKTDIIVNFQGDAPLTPPAFVTSITDTMRADPSIRVTTPVLRCDKEALGNFLADRRAGRVGATTVVSNARSEALYFSKEVIPFTDGRTSVNGIVPVFHHVGLYAYRRAALEAYMQWEPGPLETLEGLEQLRFLENGHSVHTTEVTLPGAAFWELNNPSDVPLIEGYLAQMGVD